MGSNPSSLDYSLSRKGYPLSPPPLYPAILFSNLKKVPLMHERLMVNNGEDTGLLEETM